MKFISYKQLIKIYIHAFIASKALAFESSKEFKAYDEGDSFTFSDYFHYYKAFVDSATNLVYDITYGERCPYVENPTNTIRSALMSNIEGQNLAIDEITAAFQNWEFDRKSGRQKSLVLSLTGQTGVGKTASSFIIANALFSDSVDNNNNGFLTLNGVDYINAEKVAFYQDSIRKRISETVQKCGGNVVILFDEIQKVVAGTLDILIPIMEDRSYMMLEINGKMVNYDCRNFVIILVTDIGGEKIRSGILPYKERYDIPKSVLMSRVRKSLDEKWENTQFGKMVRWIIPYLPLRRYDVFKVLKLKIEKISMELKYADKAQNFFATTELLWHISGQEYMPYGAFVYKNTSKGGKSINGNYDSEEIRHYFSVYGGRVERNGGPIFFLKNMILTHFNGSSSVKLHALMMPIDSEQYAVLYSCPNDYDIGMSSETKQTYSAVEKCDKVVAQPLYKNHVDTNVFTGMSNSCDETNTCEL